MSGQGSGQDYSTLTISNEGQIQQIEQAGKVVENAQTIVGIKCKDGILVGAEKQMISKMAVDGCSKRIHRINQYITVIFTGHQADGLYLVKRARDESEAFQGNFGTVLTAKALCERLNVFVHMHTFQGVQRPLGLGVLLLSNHPDEGFKLHQLNQAGEFYSVKATALGRGKQTCKAEIEKMDDFDQNKTTQEVLQSMVRALHLSHEDSPHKKFELEMATLTANGLKVFQSKDIQDLETKAFDDIEDNNLRDK